MFKKYFYFAESYQVYKITRTKSVEGEKNVNKKKAAEVKKICLEQVFEDEEDSESTEMTASISVDASLRSEQVLENSYKGVSRRVEFGLSQDDENQELTVAPSRETISRLEYSLTLIDKTFDDIFTAIDVNKNYLAKDAIEQERAKKRVKDFSCRLGRLLYQTRQNYTSLKNQTIKSSFAGRSAAPGAESKLAQLFVSVRNMLTSYLHYIPLSGGELFPSIISDILEIILDIGNLTSSLGFQTRNLPQHVRRLEQLYSSKQDSVNVEILNELARNTFGKPKNKPQTQRGKKSPRKLSSKQSVIKPKPTKIFQARTNLARMRRMESVVEEDSRNTVSEMSSFVAEKSVNQSNRGVDQVDKKLSRPRQADVDLIRKRLHNLELLASAPHTNDISNETKESINNAFNPSHDNLKYLINRIEAIESDFDLIAAKYDLRSKSQQFSPFKSRYTLRGKQSFESFLPKREAQTEARDAVYSRSLVEGIVNKITDEILSSDLTNIS